jgi:hypothetical protein
VVLPSFGGGGEEGSIGNWALSSLSSSGVASGGLLSGVGCLLREGRADRAID